MQANGVEATFPAGAVAEDSVATVARTSRLPAQLPDGWAGLYGVRIGATTMSGKQLGQTAQPYTVQASYTDAELAAAGITDAATLTLLQWDGAAWQPISNGVDTQNKLVSGATNLLQPLALAGEKTGGQGGNNVNLYLPHVRR